MYCEPYRSWGRAFLHPEISSKQALLIRRVLQWSETAKGGTSYQRQKWLEKGYPLAIHNIASAQIYREENSDAPEDAEIIELLIRTHGGIGQCIRGEISVSQNQPLTTLRRHFSEQELTQILYVLNKCIIKGVNDELWSEHLQKKVLTLCQKIAEDHLEELSPETRLQHLSGIYRRCSTQELARSTSLFSTRVFPYYELWFFESALSDFSVDEVYEIMEKILSASIPDSGSYISFKPLQDTLYYDYEGQKRINVYKKRIIEKMSDKPY